MKKIHAVFLSLLLVVPGISFASINKDLKYGTQGSDVKELQEFLIEKGFLSGDASGNFFSLTRKAVIAYQSSVGLPGTGYVGAMTREKINDGVSFAAPVAQASTTAPVVSGCSSTVGFSVTTGEPCFPSAATSTTLSVNKTATFPNGAIAEIDARGDIVRWIKEASTTPSDPRILEEASIAKKKEELIATSPAIIAIDAFLNNPTVESLKTFCEASKTIMLRSQRQRMVLDASRTDLVAEDVPLTLHDASIGTLKCDYLLGEAKSINGWTGRSSDISWMFRFAHYDPNDVFSLDPNDYDALREAKISFNKKWEGLSAYKVIGFYTYANDNPTSKGITTPQQALLKNSSPVSKAVASARRGDNLWGSKVMTVVTAVSSINYVLPEKVLADFRAKVISGAY